MTKREKPSHDNPAWRGSQDWRRDVIREFGGLTKMRRRMREIARLGKIAAEVDLKRAEELARILCKMDGIKPDVPAFAGANPPVNNGRLYVMWGAAGPKEAWKFYLDAASKAVQFCRWYNALDEMERDGK